MPSPTTPAVIHLNAAALGEWARREDLPSDTAIAERIGYNQTTVSRILRGDTAPGEKFIAAALAVTGMKFEDLFEIVGAS